MISAKTSESPIREGGRWRNVTFTTATLGMTFQIQKDVRDSELRAVITGKNPFKLNFGTLL